MRFLLLFGLDLEYWVPLVVTALRAYAVRRMRFAMIDAERTIRVHLSGKHRHLVMRAAFPRSSIGMSTFRIWHKFSLRKLVSATPEFLFLHF
ncbi:MAG: hypothetical protein A3C47_06840 [Omnitrophica bacterium RIFCSPHIGHO2_02_FULL_51_18]|nr:MAG: hypothetical protein A3C47_06840 [Omnitrophica bacterium RIFCSPHIGHO2_02_FULL_51_18]